MNTREISAALGGMFAELVNGPPASGAYILNRSDVGMLASLDKLSAPQASSSAGGATVAAHADHVRYGLALLNRWAAGEENPWSDADWSGSWRIRTVSDAEWASIRSRLRSETQRWLEHLRTPREVNEVGLSGMIASIAHLAYHLGAIRQIERSARGPSEEEALAAAGR